MVGHSVRNLGGGVVQISERRFLRHRPIIQIGSDQWQTPGFARVMVLVDGITLNGVPLQKGTKKTAIPGDVIGLNRGATITIQLPKIH